MVSAIYVSIMHPDTQYPSMIRCRTAKVPSVIMSLMIDLPLKTYIADRDLLEHLIARFRELDPDADRIIQMRLDNPKISDRKIAEILGRPQRTFADQMKRYYTGAS
jgi:hypothetical protein